MLNTWVERQRNARNVSAVAPSGEKWLMFSFSGTVVLSKSLARNMYYFYN